MYLRTHAHDLINIETGELDPDAVKLLHMFPRIVAINEQDYPEPIEWLLRDNEEGKDSYLEISFGQGDETTKEMVELALLKAGVPMIADPFANEHVWKIVASVVRARDIEDARKRKQAEREAKRSKRKTSRKAKAAA